MLRSLASPPVPRPNFSKNRPRIYILFFYNFGLDFSPAIDNPNGAKAAATIYSLIETCKANNIEPYAYLKYVLGEIVHANTIEDLEKLLPFNCTPEQLSQAWEPRQG